jgi:cyclophilin family peptidyl-prolyl cis-trans isomerase
MIGLNRTKVSPPIFALLLLLVPWAQISGAARARDARAVPAAVMVRILRAEDERRWDNHLLSLLSNQSPQVRCRAALAAGRIGDERAVGPLIALLKKDRDVMVRAMAAFALGETESPVGIDALIQVLSRAGEPAAVRARAIEALGKIAAQLPKTEEARARLIGSKIADALEREVTRTATNDQIILLGLTALLRARAESAAPVLAKFLAHADARVRADAANALARLRVKDKEVSSSVRPLLNDGDPIVRANAARALGAAEDSGSLDALIRVAVSDRDERVRVSALRSLALLKEARGANADFQSAAGPLRRRLAELFVEYNNSRSRISGRYPRDEASVNEMLEIAAAFGRIYRGTQDELTVYMLGKFREQEQFTAPEIEIALSRVAPERYVSTVSASEETRATLVQDWHRAAGVAQGLAEIAAPNEDPRSQAFAYVRERAQRAARALLDDPRLPALAAPDALRAYAAFNPDDRREVLHRWLRAQDVIARATAAELLGQMPPDAGTTRCLADSLPAAMHDEMNDAALAILDALAKQKSEEALAAIKTALASEDHLIRRRAVAALKANGAGDFASKIGAVKTRNTLADYRRAIRRLGRDVRAVVETDKGTLTLRLLPDEAPLTVDNFVMLARRGFFDGLTFHRVVPNFVIQGGDPRGDGNGGPGYQIRCEINLVPYERGMVGMALSGKDTGGSQWFVTHSPQPHLDGGYTVFGRVIEGMKVVDRIARGDRIRRISIIEGK